MQKKKKEQNAASEAATSTRSAVLVKPGLGQTYVEVLQKLKSNISLTDIKVEVKGVQKTKGALFNQLYKVAGNRQNFKAAVAGAVAEAE